jgi:AraC-like DNA-binding protein
VSRGEANPVWTGYAQIHPGWGLFRGTAGDNRPHRHHAVQIAIGIDEPVQLWAEKPGELRAAGAVIAADCLHRLGPVNRPLHLIYIERESRVGRALDTWCRHSARPLSEHQRQRLLRVLLEEPVGQVPEMVAKAILGAEPSPPSTVDERVRRSIAGLPRPLPERVPLAHLARSAGLSPSRYAHVFSAQTGMPVRPYLRWLRLQYALVEVARGASLTNAAYAAGFSDSAHLSRTFRKTFGVKPNVLLHPNLNLEAMGH